jgi:Glycosyl transferases group 1
VVLVASSASTAILTRMFPRLRDRIVRLAPPIGRAPPAPGSAARSGDKTLNVALLGNFSRNKGGDTLFELFRKAEALPIVFHVFGRVDPEYTLVEFLGGRVRTHGIFEPGQLPEALSSCQVALFLSPWPETYCITLSEAQTQGLVPIVTALGGQAERVVDGKNGFHVPVNDAGSVFAILERLLDSPELLENLQGNQPVPAGSSSEDFIGQLTTIYRNLLADRPPLAAIAEVRRTMALDELGVVVSSPRWVVGAPPAAPPRPDPDGGIPDARGPAPALKVVESHPDPVSTILAQRMQHASRPVRLLLHLCLSERPFQALMSVAKRQAGKLRSAGARRGIRTDNIAGGPTP